MVYILGEMVREELDFAFNSILMGLKIIFFYDILRIIRIFIRCNVFFENVTDFIFAIISGLFVFGMIFFSNNGVIRLFSLGLIVITIWLYNKYISKFVIKLVNKGYKSVRKALQKPFKAYKMK